LVFVSFFAIVRSTLAGEERLFVQAILDTISRHKAGQQVGITSVCSAHPLVIAAACRHALRAEAPFVLIEATSNQVNQFGGYTGMRPAQFRLHVEEIAVRAGLAPSRVLLGGDHLGPNAWQDLPAAVAMANADAMISEYVATGFRKIHLDCSMACADDAGPLADEQVAERAARLCLVAEAAHKQFGGEPPVYVIGTEVPVPGGATEELDALAVTTPERALATIEIHERIFRSKGLSEALGRVVALVVQPGVEFDHHHVVDYDPAKAVALSRTMAANPRMVYEAHSTDYQGRLALCQLVRDHFAILKVGPAVTFALREALWALDAMEREWLGSSASGFRGTVMAVLKRDPKHWIKYYASSGKQLEFDLQYSLSDRIRYYWANPAISTAQAKLFANLTNNPPPLALISQYLPAAYAAVRAGCANNLPEELVVQHIMATLDDYAAACRQ
jgi:D-tagatose-1,6-bisphosphate aldolase subunit GatZ/KbaZ